MWTIHSSMDGRVQRALIRAFFVGFRDYLRGTDALMHASQQQRIARWTASTPTAGCSFSFLDVGNGCQSALLRCLLPKQCMLLIALLPGRWSLLAECVWRSKRTRTSTRTEIRQNTRLNPFIHRRGQPPLFVARATGWPYRRRPPTESFGKPSALQ